MLGQEPRSPARPAPWRRMGWILLATAIGAAALAPGVSERRTGLGTPPQVPDLVGKTLAEAAQVMAPLRLGFIVAGSGRDPSAPAGVVLAQTPLPGHRLPIGSVILVKISQGSGIVPPLRGDPVHRAARRLEAIGLRLGRVHYIEDDAPPDTVLEQFTPPGRQLSANSPVDVLVSQGPAGVAADLPPLAQGSAALSGVASPTVPSTAVPSLGAVPISIILGPSGDDREGNPRVGSAPGDCPPDPQHQRAQVCGEPANHRGTQRDLYRREHRDVPPGP